MTTIKNIFQKVQSNGEVYFFLALFLISIYLLGITVQYNPDQRLFPLIVLVLLICLALIEIAREFFDVQLLRNLEIQQQHDVKFVSFDRENVTLSREIAITVWVLVSVVLIYLFGFLIGTFVFIVSFLRITSDMRWSYILMTTLSVILMIYILFIQILSVRMYEGVISFLII